MIRLGYGGILLLSAICVGPVLQSSAIAQSAASTELFQCLIQPYAIVNLGSPADGVLESITVDRGDHVTEGQVVAKLESGVEEVLVDVARAHAEADVQIKAGQAKLDYQRRRLERSEQLHQKKVVSLSAVEESRTEKTIAELGLQEGQLNLHLAQLELRRAVAVLNRRTIRSPMHGVVVERFLSPGEYVNEQAPLLKLARVDLLNVEAFMHIAYYGTIRTGMRAEVLPQEPVGGRYVANVTVVDKLLDAASGTFRVRLTLPNEDLSLPAGVRCHVRFLDD